MKVLTALFGSLLSLMLASALMAQTSPAVPEKVWRAIENEISGDNAFDLLRHLTLYHAPNGSNDDFEAQARWVVEKAREYGLKDTKVFWVGGTSRPWNVRSGEAWIVEPDLVKIGDTLETPLRVAVNSRSADLTAELVDVGDGTKDSDYEGEEIKGRIVLAAGALSSVHELAVWKHKAAGVLSYAPQRPYFPDQVAFAFLPYESKDEKKDPAFAFILTQREGDALHARLDDLKREGKKARVRVKIETWFNDPRQGIAEGFIPGTDPADDDIVLTAHMQEERTSANDDRSGVANLLEISRTINRLITQGKLERPRRNIRFWWLDEIGAQYRYFAEHPEAARAMMANLNQDMVGAKQSVGFRVQFMSRTPYSRPSFLNDIVESVVNAVIWGNTAVPLRRGSNNSSFSRPMFALKGTREPFRAMPVPFYDSTDHMPFNDGRVGVPGISLTNWPDDYIHSTDDDLWQIDATQLKRNAFIIAVSAYTLASAGPPDLYRMAALVMGGAQERLGRDAAMAMKRLADPGAGDPAARYRDAVMLLDTAAWREAGAIDSLSDLGGAGSPENPVIRLARERTEQLARSLRADIDTFYRHSTGRPPTVVLNEVEKKAADRFPSWKATLLEVQTDKVKLPDGPENLHGHYLFEVRNLIDGKRSILEIYERVRAAALSAGEWYYGPVELAQVSGYIDALENAGAIRVTGRD